MMHKGAIVSQEDIEDFAHDPGSECVPDCIPLYLMRSRRCPLAVISYWVTMPRGGNWGRAF